jgi:predicted aspartyl protease
MKVTGASLAIGGRSGVVSICRLWTLAACALWFTSATAFAECQRPPTMEAAGMTPVAVDTAGGDASVSRGGRMVAPIFVNGQGPFRFIIDTGANRSVLSPALAQRLGLSPIGQGQVHSVHGVTDAPLVRVRSLHYNDLALPAADLPLLQGPLSGEQGLLGVDGMEGRRLLLDFRRRCIEIIPSLRAPRLRGWTPLRGELRFNHLVVIPGRINRVPVNVLIDTGSDATLANTALRRAIEASVRRERSFFAVAQTATRPIVLDTAMIMPRLTLGELNIEHVAAYVGDYHVFTLWNMQDQPTLLLGMDVLSQADAMAIDYGTGTVYFRLDAPHTGSRLFS